MKKVMAWMAALTVMVFAACACAETPVRMMYDSVMRLLFETSNVTLTGHAEFFLDGGRFKTADARYVQDGTNSVWEWKLLTPRPDGTEREGGYTVIANGENVYVVEAYYPGVYKTGTTDESDTILRESVQLGLLRDLLRILADQSDTLLGEDACEAHSDETGLTVHIRAGEDVPELVNTALNMTVQFAAKRYFSTDYDYVSERYMVPMGNYNTVTQAILGSTYYMSLKQADVTLKRDAGGNFESADGKLSLELKTKNDGTRVLDIAFELAVSDLGGSSVDPFNPDDYGVKPTNGAAKTAPSAGKSIDPETEKKFLEAAKARWQLAGYQTDDSMEGSVIIEGSQPRHEDEWIHVEFVSEDGSACWHYYTDSAGSMLGLQNMTNVWQGTLDERHFEEYPDEKLVKETAERLLSWMAEENPDLSEGILPLKNDWWYQKGNELYLHFWEDGEPVKHAWDEVDFVVRTAPEWRIEYFSCIANG